MIIKCLKCGKEKRTFPSRVRVGGGKFCSRQCANAYNNVRRSNPLTYRSGKDSPNYGKRGANSGGWKGGKYIRRGYVMIYVPENPNCDIKGYVLEHRLIMEKKLGRYLKKSEVVHHMNHIKDDNKPENLILLNSVSEHMALHPENLEKARKVKNE